MRELELEELKRLQLDILSEVDVFCKQHDLCYSLAYGSLLGAVRHKGFIPWDDDIDIWMPRNDYEFFRKNFNSRRYFMVDEIDGIPLPYGKVCDSKTQLVEHANHSFSLGVFIDVFPVDYLPLNMSKAKKIKREIHRLYLLKFIKDIKLNSSRSSTKNVFLAISKMFTSIISYRYILKKINLLMTGTKIDNSNYMTDYNEFEKKVIFPLNTFSSMIELSFENKMFWCISCYEEVLKQIYGNYMLLPPEEKRVTHHSYTATIKP